MATFERAGSIEFGAGYPRVEGAVFDRAGGKACVLVSTYSQTASMLVGVDLRTFRVTGELALAEEDAWVRCIAAGAGRAYASPYDGSDLGRLIEIDLRTMTRARELQVPGGSVFGPAAIVDAEGRYGYFENGSGVLRIDLASFTVTGQMPHPAGHNDFVRVALDPTGNIAYFASDEAFGKPAKIARIDLDTLTHTGTLELQAGEEEITAAMVDPIRGAAFFGTRNGSLIKIDLATFTRAGDAEPLEAIGCGVFDTARGEALLGGAQLFTPVIAKSNGATLANAGAIELNSAGPYGPPAVYLSDPARNAIYLAGQTILKIDTATGNRAGELEFPGGVCGALDSAGNAAYFAGGAKVAKASLDPFAIVAELPLDSASDEAACAGVDATANTLYVGVNGGKIVRIGLDTFSITGTLSLGAGEQSIVACAIDETGRSAYFTIHGPTASVVKVNLDTFTRVGAISLSAGIDKPAGIGLDGAGSAFVLGWEHQLYRIDLATFQKTETLDLDPAFPDLRPEPEIFAIDAAHGTLYSGSGSTFGLVAIKASLNPMALRGVAVLTNAYPSASPGLAGQAVDPARRTIYYMTTGPQLIRMREGEGGRGSIHGTGVTLPTAADVQLMRFHSHKAVGKLRLSIYKWDFNNGHKLMWESPELENRAEGADVVVPLTSGKPTSLRIPAGIYVLAWQTDTTEAVASYAGEAGFPFSYPLKFGASPALIQEQANASIPGEAWTQSIDYEIAALTPSPTASMTPTVSTSPTGSLTPTPSATASVTPVFSPTPWVSPTPSATPGAPVFVLHPKGLSVNVGAGFSFEALATAGGPIDYAWVRDGQPVPGAEGPTLHVSNAAAADAGWYQCAAQTLGGRTLSEAAQLVVVSPAAANDAQFGGSSGPAVSAPGAEYNMGIVFVNTSPLSWSAAQGYRLRILDDPGGLFGGATGLELSEATPVVAANGGSATFIARVKAPAAPGFYDSHVQMHGAAGGGFGEIATIALEVIPPPNGAGDWATYE